MSGAGYLDSIGRTNIKKWNKHLSVHWAWSCGTARSTEEAGEPAEGVEMTMGA